MMTGCYYWNRKALILGNGSVSFSFSAFVIARNYEPLPPAKRDETLPCALFLFIGKCMEMIVQSIAEEIKVVEFHSPNPKFFRCVK